MSKKCIEKEGIALYTECLECKEKLCEYFYCLVVGSRSFNDYNLLKNKLDILLKNKHKIVIVSGGARGTDTLAGKYARENNYILKVINAEWDIYGKLAGYIRNEKMHKYISYAKDRGVVMFWYGESKGTYQNFELAKKYKNQIKVIRV